jgi:hypothetical protein
VQQVSYGPLIMSIMLMLIYTSRTIDGCPFKPKKLSVPFLYPRVPAGLAPFKRTSASRTEKPGAYSTPGTPSGRGEEWDGEHVLSSVLNLKKNALYQYSY